MHEQPSPELLAMGPHTSVGSHNSDTDERSLTLAEVRTRGLVQLGGDCTIFDSLVLPTVANACAASGGSVAAWIAPRRWLLIGSRASAARWLSLGLPGMTVVDQSHGRAIVRITGEWQDLLRQGCPLDLSFALAPDRWSCAQSLFCDVPVFLLVPPHAEWIELYAPRSYRETLWSLLLVHIGLRPHRIAAPLSDADYR